MKKWKKTKKIKNFLCKVYINFVFINNYIFSNLKKINTKLDNV